MATRRKLQRTLSCGRTEDQGAQERKERFSSPDKPCHQIADSYFSTSSGFSDFHGLINWGALLLVLSNARVALENVIKYGVLVNPVQWLKILLHEPYSWPAFLITLLLVLFIGIAYLLEKLLYKSKISEVVGWYLCRLNLIFELSIGAYFVWTTHPNPLFSSVTLGLYSIICLKMYSYHDINTGCRTELQDRLKSRHRNKSVSCFRSYSSEYQQDNGHKQPKQVYPNNLNIRDLLYYVAAPTLCYQLNFPRSARIRKRFLLKRLAEMVFLTGLIASCIQQWIAPTVQNSMVLFNELHFPKLVERLLKLSVPNHLIWLIFFYWFFHSCLNVLAELLRFGDRVFYRDWWNADTIQGFWQNWNIPVHKFALRHVYKPMLSKGFSKWTASIVVFLCSAFFHEYLVSIPLRMFRLWAFLSMLGQVPLAWFVNRYVEGRWGNVIIWLSLIIGQPAALLMYYHDYYVQHNLATV